MQHLAQKHMRESRHETWDDNHPAYWKMRSRTHEWCEHQLVSLWDVPGIGKGTIRALISVGVSTAQELMAADVNDLAAKLRPWNIPPCPIDKAPQVIREWQRATEKLWKSRSAGSGSQSDDSQDPT